MAFHRQARVTQTVAAAFLSLTLAACGGGGSGDGGTGSGTSSGTGLIPAAPTPGATLAADATTLRPLIAGASWSYAGTDTVRGSSNSYTDVVTQTASGSEFTETASNAFNEGPDTSTLGASGGTLTSRSVLGLTDTNQTISYPELRSPVRQNDQTTVFDQHLNDIGADVDGDGKHDAADVAIYRLVVGMESVGLPNAVTVQAVRVDMIAMVRVTGSASGKTTPAVQAALQSTWYVPNIGIVKQRLTTPVSDTENEVVEEVLSYFDGVDHGLGLLPAVTSKPQSDDPTYAGWTFGQIRSFIPMGDQLVVRGGLSQPNNSGLVEAYVTVDRTGKVTHTSVRDGLSLTGTLLAIGGQLYAIDTGLSCSVTVTPIDISGPHLVAGSPRTLAVPAAARVSGEKLCSSLNSLKIASDGSRLWLAAVRNTVASSGWNTDLYVQAFGLDGVAQSPEVAMTPLGSATFGDDTYNVLGLTAANGKAVVRYVNQAGGQVQLASIGLDGSPTTTTLAFTPSYLMLQSVADGSIALWQGGGSSEQTRPLNAFWMDGALNPVLTGSGTALDAQSLGAAFTLSGGFGLSVASDNSVVINATTLAPNLFSFSSITLARFKPGALASQAAVPLTLQDADAANSFVFALADRVLLVKQEGISVSSRVVWMP